MRSLFITCIYYYYYSQYLVRLAETEDKTWIYWVFNKERRGQLYSFFLQMGMTIPILGIIKFCFNGASFLRDHLIREEHRLDMCSLYHR